MSGIIPRVVSIGLLFSVGVLAGSSSEAQDPEYSKQILVTIPLRDEAGATRAHLTYRWNPGRPSTVHLFDVRSRSPVAVIPAEGAAPSSPPADLPPLRSEPYREPPGTFGRGSGRQGALNTGRSDSTSDVNYLLGYVRHLETRLKQVEQRLNDASRRR